MNEHDQIHNDIKPQNYLVKFLNGDKDLSSIEIVLTDFGLAGSDIKGGTPVFASPECLASPDRKEKSSDIFSLGRVFLFIILPKAKFLEYLFVPLKDGKGEIMKLIENEPILNLNSKMMRIKGRLGLPAIRIEIQAIQQLMNLKAVSKISDIIQKSTSNCTTEYIDVLKNFS